jgi:hypothetical protein
VLHFQNSWPIEILGLLIRLDSRILHNFILQIGGTRMTANQFFMQLLSRSESQLRHPQEESSGF